MDPAHVGHTPEMVGGPVGGPYIWDGHAIAAFVLISAIVLVAIAAYRRWRR